MTKEEFIEAFTDQKISVYTPTVPEREALLTFFENETSLHCYKSYNLSTYPYSVYANENVTGWTGKSTEDNRWQIQLSFDEFMQIINGNEDEEIDATGLEGLL